MAGVTSRPLYCDLPNASSKVTPGGSDSLFVGTFPHLRTTSLRIGMSRPLAYWSRLVSCNVLTE